MGFSDALIKKLAARVSEGVPGLSNIYQEWPNKNTALSYPSVSLVTGVPRFTRCAPYLLSQGVTNGTTKQATTKYIVGQFEVMIQLDLWAAYKPQRASFLELLFSFLQPAAPKGLVLDLAADYHNQFASVMMLDYKFMDSDDASTLQQWRAMLSLEAICLAVSTTTEYVITQEPVLIFDIPTTPIDPDEEVVIPSTNPPASVDGGGPDTDFPETFDGGDVHGD